MIFDTNTYLCGNTTLDGDCDASPKRHRAIETLRVKYRAPCVWTWELSDRNQGEKVVIYTYFSGKQMGYGWGGVSEGVPCYPQYSLGCSGLARGYKEMSSILADQ